MVLPPSVAAAPHQIASRGDVQPKNGPRFILTGTADLQHNAWFGSEGQGVYLYANGGWKQFTTAEGLGDDDVCALACDSLGRIWAGTLAHGVSIFNGSQWKTFSRVAGCGGSRVFCIKVCPTDGDVWIATEQGLTRYSLKGDTWKYYGTAEGLPAALVSSIAFDSRGNLFAGLQSNGVAFAHSADGYSHWTNISGPDETPIRPSGAGLPSSAINAMLVTRDDTVYAGTTRGLACSVDHGSTWSYLRGKNWATVAQGRYEGMPDDFDVTGHSPLAEDWIQSLMEDPTGMIWIGYQNAGDQAFTPTGKTADSATAKGYITAMVPLADGRCIMGTYGAGVWERGTQYAGPSAPAGAAPVSALSASAFPTPIVPPDVAALDAMRQRIESLPVATNGVEFLPDDWETGGDWIGRYGGKTADLLGYGNYHLDPAYKVALTTGPYRKAWMRYYWDDTPKLDQVRLLLDPKKKIRLYCENNDNSFDTKSFPRQQEGPDLYVRVTVPAGTHVVSLFFQNHDSQSGPGTTGQRDFILQVKNPTADDDNPDDEPYGSYGYYQVPPADSTEAELEPTIARSRVSSFHDGVYKRLLIRGSGTWWIKINRNHSPCVKVSTVFIDRVDDPANGQKEWFNPAFKSVAADYSTDAGIKGAAAKLMKAVDLSSGRDGFAALADRARLMAYRAGLAAGMDDSTLAEWRQKMLLWNDDDRDQFDKAAGIALPGGL